MGAHYYSIAHSASTDEKCGLSELELEAAGVAASKKGPQKRREGTDSTGGWVELRPRHGASQRHKTPARKLSLTSHSDRRVEQVIGVIARRGAWCNSYAETALESGFFSELLMSRLFVRRRRGTC